MYFDGSILVVCALIFEAWGLGLVDLNPTYIQNRTQKQKHCRQTYSLVISWTVIKPLKYGLSTIWHSQILGMKAAAIIVWKIHRAIWSWGYTDIPSQTNDHVATLAGPMDDQFWVFIMKVDL